jgi:hypothetical protein
LYVIPSTVSILLLLWYCLWNPVLFGTMQIQCEEQCIKEFRLDNQPSCRAPVFVLLLDITVCCRVEILLLPWRSETKQVPTKDGRNEWITSVIPGHSFNSNSSFLVFLVRHSRVGFHVPWYYCIVVIFFRTQSHTSNWRLTLATTTSKKSLPLRQLFCRLESVDRVSKVEQRSPWGVTATRPHSRSRLGQILHSTIDDQQPPIVSERRLKFSDNAAK